MRNQAKLYALTVLLAVNMSCSDDFDPYNLLRGVRVLAVQAEPPSLAPTETTTLSALTWQPADSTDTLLYSWSWCPFRGPSGEGSPCAVEEDEFAELLGIPPGALPFDLGNADTANFTNPLDAATIEAVCTPPEDIGDLPDFVALPDCSEGLPITVRLALTAGGETIEVIKEVRLLAATAPDANANPSLGNVRFSVDPAPETEAVEILSDGTTYLDFAQDYVMFIDIPGAAIQTFTPPGDEFEAQPDPKQERMFLTWFVSEGETDAVRTTFLEGEVPMSVLRTNTWMLPRADEIDADTAELVFVLRDERGGVAWTERTVNLGVDVP